MAVARESGGGGKKRKRVYKPAPVSKARPISQTNKAKRKRSS